jgi:phage terminase large subunit-like protein
MDQVQIQLQDTTGNWRTFHVTMNNSQMILSEMKQLASRYPNQRVRAVDMDGKLVDIL